MTALVANNATSRLAGAVNTTQTSITVQAADAEKFPSPTGNQWFPLTMVKADGQLEILKATARAGDVITVERAQEATTAKAFDVGDRVELRLTKAFYDQFSDEFDAFLVQAQGDVDAFIADGNFTRYDLASVSVTATLDLATSNVFRVDASVARTLAFANAPGANRAMTVVVHITGNSAVTWPTGIDWDSDAAPELGDNETKVVLLWDGIEWSGFVRVSK